MKKKSLPVIGWREWLALPELGIRKVKAKVDTGARSSSLHAFDVRIQPHRRRPTVRFKVHPNQRDHRTTVTCEAPLHDERWVRSSNGKRELRPVIRTLLKFLDDAWMIEVTLTSRDMMGFRMLLGREAIRGRCVVHAGRSYLSRKIVKKKRRRLAQ